MIPPIFKKIHKNPAIEVKDAKNSGKVIITAPAPRYGLSTALLALLIFSDSDFFIFSS